MTRAILPEPFRSFEFFGSPWWRLRGRHRLAYPQHTCRKVIRLFVNTFYASSIYSFIICRYYIFHSLCFRLESAHIPRTVAGAGVHEHQFNSRHQVAAVVDPRRLVDDNVCTFSHVRCNVTELFLTFQAGATTLEYPNFFHVHILHVHILLSKTRFISKYTYQWWELGG